jgi:single-strand DNA-binding protein
MYALNRIQIIGHLTEKPELRQLSNGVSVTDLNVKITERITKDDGDPVILSSYHTITLWRRMAEIACDYCNAGSQVFVAGRIKTDSWEADGQKRYKTKVVADELILLDSRKDVPALGENSLLSGGLNQSEIIGNTTRDPELRQTTNGQNVANFNIATNRKWQDRNTGESKEETEYHAVVAWGELAKEVSESISSGQKVYVRGRLQTRSWETPEGEKRYTTETIADQVLLLGAKNAELASGAPAAAETAAAEPAPKKEAAPSKKPESQEKDPDADLPTIKYESDIKPEDLPF